MSPPCPRHARPMMPAGGGPPASLSATGSRFLQEAIGLSCPLRRELLARVHDIVVSPEIATASVSLRAGRFLLSFNPDFVDRLLPTAADKRFVLMHELAHLQRGDLLRVGRFFSAWPRLTNLALDIFVNGSVLGAAAFDGRDPGVLARCYAAGEAPWCLLRPPGDLLAAWSGSGLVQPDTALLAAAQALLRVRSPADTAQARGRRRPSLTIRPPSAPASPTAPPDPLRVLARLTPALAEGFGRLGLARSDEAARLYLDGWLRRVPFSSFLPRLHRLLEHAGLLAAIEGRPLLLEHGPAALDAQARSARSTQRPGYGDQLHQHDRAAPVRPPLTRAERTFYAALRAALVSDPRQPQLRAAVPWPASTVLLHPGRREVALLAAGTWPILCQAPEAACARGPSDDQVHLYLDVSASMDALLGLLYGLTLTATDLIGQPLYLFSNRVVPASFADLEAGRVQTTGGTDLECVAAHARAAGHRRLLIVTDGYVRPLPETCQLLRDRLETYVVLVTRSARAPESLARRLATYARKWWCLPASR